MNIKISANLYRINCSILRVKLTVVLGLVKVYINNGLPWVILIIWCQHYTVWCLYL